MIFMKRIANCSLEDKSSFYTLCLIGNKTLPKIMINQFTDAHMTSVTNWLKLNQDNGCTLKRNNRKIKGHNAKREWNISLTTATKLVERFVNVCNITASNIFADDRESMYKLITHTSLCLEMLTPNTYISTRQNNDGFTGRLLPSFQNDYELKYHWSQCLGD